MDRVYKELDSAYEATLEALVAALDVREWKTVEHSVPDSMLTKHWLSLMSKRRCHSQR